jgi:predicted S18 family serine protease
MKTLTLIVLLVLLAAAPSFAQTGGNDCTVKYYYHAQATSTGGESLGGMTDLVESLGSIPGDDHLKVTWPNARIFVAIEVRAYDPEGNEYTVIDSWDTTVNP